MWWWWKNLSKPVKLWSFIPSFTSSLTSQVVQDFLGEFRPMVFTTWYQKLPFFVWLQARKSTWNGPNISLLAIGVVKPCNSGAFDTDYWSFAVSDCRNPLKTQHATKQQQQQQQQQQQLYSRLLQWGHVHVACEFLVVSILTYSKDSVSSNAGYYGLLPTRHILPGNLAKHVVWKTAKVVWKPLEDLFFC